MSVARHGQGPLSALDRTTVWLNSEPLTAGGLCGRVVLADFCTYSCVNWLRRCRTSGRGTGRIVSAGCRRRCARARVRVRARPRKRAARGARAGHRIPRRPRQRVPHLAVVRQPLLAGRLPRRTRGRVGFHHFGEGAYEETERAIQHQLGIDEATVEVDADGVSKAADWQTLKSPETYLGRSRSENRSSDRRAGELALNHWTLTGPWLVGKQVAVLERGGGAIAYRFHARDLNLVLAPPATGTVRFTVRLDGEPPGDACGLDVDASGEGTVSEPGMYQLVRQRAAIRPRTFEITFLDAGVRAYVFTFR